MQRMYANIRLPVEVYTDGKFKMLYDQMEINMVSDIEKEWKDKFNEKVEEIKEEVIERLHEPEPEPEPKIYTSDYPLIRNKKRLNTTFRKNIKRNQITKKNYANIPTI